MTQQRFASGSRGPEWCQLQGGSLEVQGELWQSSQWILTGRGGQVSFKDLNHVEDLLCIYDMRAPDGQGRVHVSSLPGFWAGLPRALKWEAETLLPSSPLSQSGKWARESESTVPRTRPNRDGPEMWIQPAWLLHAHTPSKNRRSHPRPIQSQSALERSNSLL